MGKRQDEIRRYVLDHVDANPRRIRDLVRERFGLTRHVANKCLARMVESRELVSTGTGGDLTFAIAVRKIAHTIPLVPGLQEDRLWNDLILPHLGGVPHNVLSICVHGFTEMFNNVIDHSGGTESLVLLTIDARTIEILIRDDGIGVFEKIKRHFGMEDHRQAMLELTKGKLTTDPSRHSGQGIFFTSWMFDTFGIASNGLYFAHDVSGDDWMLENQRLESPGTLVSLEIAIDSPRTASQAFDRFTDLESGSYAFSKTHVPMTLANFGPDPLVSRSQAKRVLARFDRYEEVLLDFKGVDSIGQAFADEIFRVYALSHPGVEIRAVNAGPDVIKMIRRAQSEAARQSTP